MKYLSAAQCMYCNTDDIITRGFQTLLIMSLAYHSSYAYPCFVVNENAETHYQHATNHCPCKISNSNLNQKLVL